MLGITECLSALRRYLVFIKFYGAYWKRTDTIPRKLLNDDIVTNKILDLGSECCKAFVDYRFAQRVKPVTDAISTQKIQFFSWNYK